MNNIRHLRFSVSALVLAASIACGLLPASAALAGSAAGSGATAAPAARESRPNIVVILLDDLGYADVSAYHSGRIPTPNMDRLAASGVLFTHGYASAPICSPSRAGLMTGRHQQRFGFEYNNGPGRIDRDERRGLDVRELTIADVLHSAGYRTGLVGKWHLGWNDEHYPTNRGFDHFWGLLTGQTNFMRADSPDVVNAYVPTIPGESRQLTQPYTVVPPTEKLVQGPSRAPVELGDRHMTDLISEEAIRFINASGEQPFFLLVSHPAPHTPFQATKEWYDRFPQIESVQNRVYAAMIAQVDARIGDLLTHLEATGKSDNTIVILLSDNGCAAYIPDLCAAEPISGGKLTYLEGGVRVPFMMRWPTKVKAGQVVDNAVSSLDILPTAVAAAGASLPTDRAYDGEDLLAKIGRQSRSRTLFWRTQPIAAALQGDWKFIRDLDGNEYLYNLRRDPKEERNLILVQRKRAARMRTAHAEWAATMREPAWKPRTSKFEFGGRTFRFTP